MIKKIVIGLILLASLAVLSTYASIDRFDLALPGREWEFPEDHASHPTFQTEWWYYTGHLKTLEGKEYGYELTFFRRRLDSGKPTLTLSQWKADHLYLAHFAITDEEKGTFTYSEKINRAGPGIAGASEARYYVWNDNWLAEQLGQHHHIAAEMKRFKINLILTPEKEPVIHGIDGVSQKGEGKGRASYYYSLTRLKTDGLLFIDNKAYPVTGMSWMDHEFGSNQLQEYQVGWDWFSIQLDNRLEVMLFQIRHRDGKIDPYSSGTVVFADEKAEHLQLKQVQIEVLDRWKSEKSGAIYPIEWRVTIPSLDLKLHIKPGVKNQELDTKNSTRVIYWEGRVKIDGTFQKTPVSGKGYVEMTGYAAHVEL